MGLGTLALIRQMQGEHADARALLQEAGRTVEQPGLTPGARLHYLTKQLLVSLAIGDPDQAAAVQVPALEQAGSFPGYLALALAQTRLLLAQQDRAAAWDRLATLHELATRSGWVSATIQARAQQALVAPSPDKALLFLGESLALAEPEGYVRTFVDLGEPMQELLTQFLTVKQGPAAAYAGALLSTFENRVVPEARPVAPSPLPTQPLIEPLSDRELDVLALLAEGRMRQEIAQALVVSVNTIKAHLKGIYGKLDVHTRREAVARARELGLLS